MHFQRKIKWRLERLGALRIMGEATPLTMTANRFNPERQSLEGNDNHYTNIAPVRCLAWDMPQIHKRRDSSAHLIILILSGTSRVKLHIQTLGSWDSHCPAVLVVIPDWVDALQFTRTAPRQQKVQRRQVRLDCWTVLCV